MVFTVFNLANRIRLGPIRNGALLFRIQRGFIELFIMRHQPPAFFVLSFFVQWNSKICVKTI